MKKLISILLLFAMIASLAACNDEKPLTSVYDKDDFTVSLEDLKAAYSTVVLELGDQKVDLELLQIAYWTAFVNFLYRNSEYIANYNLVLGKPLREQTVPGTDHTWQQYFLNEAVTTLHNYLAAIQAAKAEGITFPKELQESVDADMAEMEKAAKDEGYTDMDAYVAYLYGPGCTFKAIKDYNYLSICSNYYQNTCISKMDITDQMVDEYYEAHRQDFVNAGMLQDDRIVYQVRHIWVAVDEGVTDEQVWEDARIKAQGLLDTYLAGEKTEESFSQLALEKSDDNETYLSGGFINGLVPQSTYPEAFKQWYLDTNRKAGDVALVKTELGYHVMYYIGIIPTWRYEATNSLTNTMVGSIIPEAVAKHPLTIHYDKLMVSEAGLEQ